MRFDDFKCCQNSLDPVSNSMDGNRCSADILDVLSRLKLIADGLIAELFSKGLIPNLTAIRFPVGKDINILHLPAWLESDEVRDELRFSLHIVDKSVPKRMICIRTNINKDAV